MKKLLAFINNMDSAAWRTIWVSLALLGGVVAIIVIASATGIADHMDEQLIALRSGPWGLPMVILLFMITSFLGAPQFALFGICVVAFGPWLGCLYAMIGTVVSAWVHFIIGRLGGADLVRRYGGDTVNRLSRFIGRNDFLASLIVRSVPTAPAVVVNMAFGASQANFWRYTAGVIIGSIPKILIVALLGQSVLSAMGGGLMLAVGLGVTVVAVWISVALAARKAVRGEPALQKVDEPAPQD
ncbi:MAG: VTT domain-containing protein [Hyphomonadaceae bacterium]